MNANEAERVAYTEGICKLLDQALGKSQDHVSLLVGLLVLATMVLEDVAPDDAKDGETIAAMMAIAHMRSQDLISPVAAKLAANALLSCAMAIAKDEPWVTGELRKALESTRSDYKLFRDRVEAAVREEVPGDDEQFH